MKTFLTLISLLLLGSCANYVSHMHHQLDRKLNPNYLQQKGKVGKEKFNRYRKNDVFNGQKKTLSYAEQLNSDKMSGNRNFHRPAVKRHYKSLKRRYKADDLVDQGNDGSLWTGRGQENFLFAKNKTKKVGDIVLIEVKHQLKEEIRIELARSFPDRPKPQEKEPEKDGKEGAKKEPAAAQNNDQDKPKEKPDPTKVYDKISSVVVEEINQDHILLRGRKDVLYKGFKRTIEVQGLIPRRSITDADSVDSAQMIESHIGILR